MFRLKIFLIIELFFLAVLLVILYIYPVEPGCSSHTLCPDVYIINFLASLPFIYPVLYVLGRLWKHFKK